jgi:dihydropteroate synthase
MRDYFRPVLQTDAARPAGALTLAGGWCWFDRVEVLRRGRPPELIAAADLPGEVRARLTAPRPPLAGLALDRPRIMGILNVTPDSFSDGGEHFEFGLRRAGSCPRDGAGGRRHPGHRRRIHPPGAAEVSREEEIARTAPVIAALRAEGIALPVSIDTRKAAVAARRWRPGPIWSTTCSALTHDAALAPLVAQAGCRSA